MTNCNRKKMEEQITISNRGAVKADVKKRYDRSNNISNSKRKGNGSIKYRYINEKKQYQV